MKFAISALLGASAVALQLEGANYGYRASNDNYDAPVYGKAPRDIDGIYNVRYLNNEVEAPERAVRGRAPRDIYDIQNVRRLTNVTEAPEAAVRGIAPRAI